MRRETNQKRFTKSFSIRSYVEVAVHVQADDAEVVGAGHVGDDALSVLPLLRHPHPHVPVPQLQDQNKKCLSTV